MESGEWAGGFLQIFQKIFSSPGDHRAKYFVKHFMTPPINFSFLFKGCLHMYIKNIGLFFHGRRPHPTAPTDKMTDALATFFFYKNNFIRTKALVLVKNLRTS